MASAVSPYAPLRRSSSLSISAAAASAGRRNSSSSVAGGGAGQVALLCLILKYWNSHPIRKLRELLRRCTDPLLTATTTTSVPRCIVDNPLVANVVESRLILAARRNVILLWNRIVSLVFETCKRLGFDDVAQTLCELVVGPRREGVAATATATAAVDADISDRRNGGCFAPVEEHSFVTSDQEYCYIGTTNADADAEASLLPRCFAHRIRTNMCQIDSVLAYWFGSGSPNASQKSLWMIASSSVERRRKVDADVDDRFGSILCQLMNEDGGEGKEETGSQLWKEWCNDEELYGWRGKVAAIIVLDQMSRHVRRNREVKGNSMPEQNRFDKLAYTTSKLFRVKHEAAIQCGMIPIPMQIFALMPYRHASTISTVGVVQESVETMAGLEKEVDDMVRRFRTATNRRMAVFQDEARREGKSNPVVLNGESSVDVEKGGSESKIFTDDDILECHAFDADMSRAEDHPVVKTVVSFLSKVGIEPYYPPGGEESSVPTGTKRKKRRAKRSLQCGRSTASPEPPKPRHVIVSLSGGVDSMVLANVLSYLSSDKRRGYQHLNVVSVHVDYGNRPESAAEASFVKRYSEEKLSVPCTVRRISEVTRGITARDEYEKIARTIRFDLYRATTAACLHHSGAANNQSGDDVGVVLGHHRGDLRENVLSNSHKGCGPLDLSGMSSVSRNDGVVIYRPLLPLEKEDVYSYAHSYGVPYFKDTTPHWSTRGKLRNKLLPVLEEIYGEGSMANLTGLAQESDEAKDLVHKAILAPIFDSVVRYPMGISFETAPWKHQGPYFWKLALRDILHSASRGMFSDKAVLSFLERAQADKIKPGWLQCRKDYATFLRQDGVCFILDPESFPLHDCDKYDTAQLTIECGGKVRVGPWTVTATMIETSCDWRDLEKKRAIDSMEAFMSGHIRYYLKVPLKEASSPFPLIFPPKFIKIGRPTAWKNTDLKIEQTLPLAGADATAEEFAMLKDVSNGYGEVWCLVCVALQRDGA